MGGLPGGADPQVVVVQQTTALPGVPRTPAELSALRARRSELSTQLQSAQRRRNEISRQLDRAEDGPDRAGIEQRLVVLDQRIIGLENEIAESGRLVAAAPAEARRGTTTFTEIGTPSIRYMGPRIDVTAIAVVFNLFVLCPIAVAFARRIWKRTTSDFAPRPAAAADSARMERLESAVDAIAVEVERIGEGQRFVTQLLADRREPVAIPAGNQGGR
jgi:hypothetical protein